MSGASQLVHYEKDVAYVHAYASLEFRFEHHVAGHRFPVPVEGKAYEFAVGVEDRAAGIASGDVAVGEEAGVQLAVRIGILAVVPRLVESLQPGRNPELVVVRVFLLHHTIEGSIVPVEDSVPRGI